MTSRPYTRLARGDQPIKASFSSQVRATTGARLNAALLCALAAVPAFAADATQAVRFSASAVGSQVVPAGWADAQFSTLPSSAGTLESVTVRWDFDITSDSTGIRGFEVFDVYTRAQGPLEINGAAYGHLSAERFAGGNPYTEPVPCPTCSC